MKKSSHSTLLVLNTNTFTLFPEIWQFLKNYKNIYYEEKKPPFILWASPFSKWEKIQGNLNKENSLFILDGFKGLKNILSKFNFNNILKLSYYVRDKNFGKKIFCVVRPMPEALYFSNELEKSGLKSFPFPVLKFKVIKVKNLKEILKDKWDYVIFTSKRGIDALRENIKDVFLLRELLIDKKIIAIGPETKKNLEEVGLDAILPEEFSQEGIMEILKEEKYKRILMLKTEGREDLKNFLLNNKNYVEEVKIYDMVKEKIERLKIFEIYLNMATHLIFTSPKLFDTFIKIFKDKKFLENKEILAIGRVTKSHIEKKGFNVNFAPQKFTGKYLLKEILKRS
ncbi:MAG: uroporphyrinogen-III synthase [candidate division WOR-3 bacterium]